MDTKIVDNSAMTQLLRSAFGPLGQIDRTEEETLREEIIQIRSQIAKLESIKNGKYLSFERPAIVKKAEADKLPLLSRLKRIDERLAEISEEHRLQEMHIYMAGKGYREQLNLDYLELKKAFPWSDRYVDLPAFMVSPVDNPSGYCKIIRRWGEHLSGRQYHTTKFLPKLPGKIEERLDKAINVDECNIKASFTGHAPDHIGESINKAKKSKLFDNILVIAEVESWRGYIKVDPIITGYKKVTDQLYFIDSYDMTPLEQFFEDQGAILVTK